MKLHIPLLLLMSALGLALLGCEANQGQPPGADSLSGEAQAAAMDMQSLNEVSRLPVEVLRLKPRNFSVRAAYTGSLEPVERVTVKAEVDGTAEVVSFDEGGVVRKGEELARIDTRHIQVRRDQAQSDFNLADADLGRATLLDQKGLISTAELDVSRNRRESALHALTTAEIELEKSVVAAPVTGLVKRRAVTSGEYLAKGQVIGELLVVHRLRARIAVPETEFRFFHVGKRVDMTFDARPGQRHEGVVVTLGAEADPESRTFPISVEIDNRNGWLRAGMLARVDAELETHHNGILVPRHAVLERESGRMAFVAEEGRATARALRTGAAVGEEVQIPDGLRAGDALIITGHQQLSAGQLVKIVNAGG